MELEQRQDVNLVLRMAFFGVLAVGAAVALWRGEHQWWVEWLLWVALGICAGGFLGSARVGSKRPSR